MITCVKCKKPIDLKKDKYTLIGTYMGKDKKESYFHFSCWQLFWEEKLKKEAHDLVQGMQQKIMPMVKEMFGGMVG